MIALIAAVARNQVIGKANDLPWYLPEDLKRFKELTTGHTVIMGRKTYESIIARLKHPLLNRINIVITSNPEYQVGEGVEKHQNLSEAISLHPNEDIFLIGGSRIFEEGIKLADTLYITELKEDYDGDVYFPTLDQTQWSREVVETHSEFDFVIYRKKAA